MHPERSRAHLHPKLPSVSLLPLLLPPEKERDYLSHCGEWDRWYTRCVAEAHDGRLVFVFRGPQTAWVALVQMMSVCGRSALRKEGSVNFLSVSTYKICMYICVSLLRFSGISWSPHHPAAPQLAAPPFPAATGAPPGPFAWQSWRFGRSPTSPPWQLLPSAALLQTVLGSDKVTPPVTVSGAVGGGWRGGKETLASNERSPLIAYEFKLMDTELKVRQWNNSAWVYITKCSLAQKMSLAVYFYMSC